MTLRTRSWLLAMALLGGSALVSRPARADAPADVRLDLAVAEVKLLGLDDTKSWSVMPETGLGARAIDDGHTLRLVAEKDGVYLVRLDRLDGTTAAFVVHVGKDAQLGVIVGPPRTPGTKPASSATSPPGTVPAVAASDSKPVPDTSADSHYFANTIDLDLDGGIGRHFGDPGKTVGFGRARVGLMFARWPVFTMIGATYELSNLAPGAFGIQGELLHLSAGVWAQGGAFVDTHAKAGVMAALGFSVFGIEGQYRGYQGDNDRLVTGFALLGKIRIPIGVILYAIDKNKNKQGP